jgi:hypothetical protein
VCPTPGGAYGKELVMKTKIIRCLLVASMLFYVGCYNTEVVTKEQLKATSTYDINVIMKDSLEYKFLNNNYSIHGDSLSGVGVQMIDGRPTEKHFNGSLSLSEIAQIKVDKFNPRETILIVGGSVLLVSFVWGAEVASGVIDHH